MPAHTQTKCQILIVDDEKFVRDLLNDLLGAKYECTTATSAAEALELITQDRFAVVISDIDMPGKNGIELAAVVRNASPNTAVMLISGNHDPEYIVGAMRAGAFDFLPKPFDIELVDMAVERAVEHSRLRREKQRYDEDLESLIRQRTDELNFLTYHDAATGLPNRVLLEDQLAGALAEARNGSGAAVLFLSIDGFDSLKDNFGHAASETIVAEAAKRITAEMGESSIAAKMYGADFAVLCKGKNDARSLLGLARRLANAINRPIHLPGNVLLVTCSIGISIFPNDGTDTARLLINAGAALSRARELGAGNIQFYADGINADAVEKLQLSSSIWRAIEMKEFDLFYQPKIDLESGRIIGSEALIRWRHPEHGLLAPDRFIGLSEEIGAIIPLGEWVLETACRQTAEWLKLGFDIDVAVNISARQLNQPGLAEKFTSLITESGLAPSNLNLEITESAVMHDPESAILRLEKFRKIGVRISLDDFGTGYSSLAHLKRLPIDVVKLDKSFIHDVESDADAATLVMAMVNLAHNLRLGVVAEGIENIEQLEFLRSIDCDQVQGFYFARPLPPAEFTRLLEIQERVGKFAPLPAAGSTISPHGAVKQKAISEFA